MSKFDPRQAHPTEAVKRFFARVKYFPLTTRRRKCLSILLPGLDAPIGPKYDTIYKQYKSTTTATQYSSGIHI